MGLLLMRTLYSVKTDINLVMFSPCPVDMAKSMLHCKRTANVIRYSVILLYLSLHFNATERQEK